MSRAVSLRLVSTLWYGLRKGGQRMPPVAEARSFADGDVLDLPGSPRIVYAPGHTRARARSISRSAAPC